MLLDTAHRAGAVDSFHRVSALVSHNITIRLRDPGQMISYIAMPAVLMLVLKPLYVRAVEGGATQVATGLLVMFSVFTISIAGNSILAERTWHTWDRLRASRAPATELLLGKCIPIFVVLVVQQTILIVYSVLVIGMPMPASIGFMVLSVAVWGFALLAIGAALAAIVRSHGELSMVSDIGALTLSSLGGALVPLSIMPGWAQVVAHISPGYWALQMMQGSVHGDTSQVLGSAAVLMGIGLVAGVFAVRRLTRGWGRSRLL